MGTPAPAITSLAKALEPSSRAASADGPNTGMPAARTASATPATSGASGPTTTSSTPSSTASAVTCAPSSWSTGWTVATCAIPALPGAQCSSVTAGSWDRERHRACSRAPPPMTRTFTLGKGSRWPVRAALRSRRKRRSRGSGTRTASEDHPVPGVPRSPLGARVRTAGHRRLPRTGEIPPTAATLPPRDPVAESDNDHW